MINFDFADSVATLPVDVSHPAFSSAQSYSFEGTVEINISDAPPPAQK